MLIGVLRFDVDPTPEFSVSTQYPEVDPAATQLSVAENTHATAVTSVMNAFMTGDQQRIKAYIGWNTDSRGDLARTWIFGGDNAMMTTSKFGSSGNNPLLNMFGKDTGVIRDNELLFAGKIHAVKGTPYTLIPNL